MKLRALSAAVAFAAATLCAPLAGATPAGPLPSNGTINVQSVMETENHVKYIFTVTGTDLVPVGNRLHLKFDDGRGYGQSLDHGKGVVATATLRNGVYTATIGCASAPRFNGPVANGNHWLRGLAKSTTGKKISFESAHNLTFNLPKNCRP